MRRLLAVDVGSCSVKLVAIRHAAAGVRVEAAVLREVPAGAVHGHVVRSAAAVGSVIRGLAREAGLRTRFAVAAVPGPAVMIRRLDVRPAPEESLDQVVVREAVRLVPDALEHAVLDYHSFGPAGPDGAVDVLVVAARRDLVQSHLAALRAAGLEPCGVDVDVFALDRLRRHTGAGASEKAPFGLVHIGARRADITVVRGDVPAFVGDVPVEWARLDAESLAREVHRALDLFGLDARLPLAGVLLSGGAAGAPGLAAALGARLRCDVALVDPFQCAALGARVDSAALAPVAPAFAVAVGLALRRWGTA